MNDFISTAEAAKILGISRVSVFNKIKSGDIKAVKVGRNYIILVMK
ncbi:helix-turn-helix domain-containing protein [Patescibacteria group bacterium]|nr:helix-turn-helix domain-containing protein [Patescibacteria group bacterium]